VLFGYYNPLYVYGEARAVDAAAEAGVDALLVVDLPVGEGAELRARAKGRGIGIVPLVAPTSSTSRIEAVAASARAEGAPFVYYVSVTGVTGSADAPLEEAGRAAGALRSEFAVPVVVGFGIDSGQKARAAAAGGADGVVVGTALVKRVETGRDAKERRESVIALVEELRNALGSR
jgi:tryptophan synthase alpha chain